MKSDRIEDISAFQSAIADITAADATARRSEDCLKAFAGKYYTRLCGWIFRLQRSTSSASSSLILWMPRIGKAAKTLVIAPKNPQF